MLFIPQEQVKKTLKRLREEGKERRWQRTLKRREAYLKAKEEGKLDEYYENLRKKIANISRKHLKTYKKTGKNDNIQFFPVPLKIDI